MARVQYQGAARASGYRPQQVDERGLARLREEGERKVRGMQAVADAEIENRRRALQAMKEDEAYTKQAMQRDYQIASGNQQRIAQGLQAEAQRDRDQFNIDTKSRTETLDSIKNFSDTAKKEADKIYERDRTQAFLDEISNGMSEENLFGKAVAQKLLAENSVHLSNARQIAAANGADEVELSKLRANDDALATDFTEGQIAAYWRWQYADDRTAYLAAKAKEFGRGLTPEEEQQYTGQFRQQIIQLMGEQSGFASKLITPYVQQYGDAADTTLFAETRRKQKEINDDRTFNMGLANISNAAPENLQRVQLTAFNLMVEAKGYTAALNALQKLYEQIDPETGQRLRDPNDLANFTFPDENGKMTTFGEKFGKTRLLDVIKNLDKAETQWKSDKISTEAVNREEWIDTEIQKLGDSYTDDQVQKLSDQFDEQFPGYTSQRIINLKKRGTIEAKVRAAELERILDKQGWELTERDVDFVKIYGAAAQAATLKDKYDRNSGIINNKDVTSIVDKGIAVLTGKNNYSDIAKAGTESAAIYYERQVNNRILQLLAEGSTQGGALVTPQQRLEAAKAAAAQAVAEENQKVKDGSDRYKVVRKGTTVSYPDIDKFFGKTKARETYDRSIDSMKATVNKLGPAAFVSKLENLFSEQRLQQLVQNPGLPPNAYEVATAQRLGISQYDLRNLGAKAAGLNFRFNDVLKTATGVAYTPAVARTMSKLSPVARRANLDSMMGNTQNYQNVTIHGRPGFVNRLTGFMGAPVETTKEYPIVLPNGQPIRIARGSASNAFDAMRSAGMPTEGITNVFRDESEYSRLVKEGYDPALGGYHNVGLAIDAHGLAGAWLHKHGAKYGWVPEPGYTGHGGHFIFKPSI